MSNLLVDISLWSHILRLTEYIQPLMLRTGEHDPFLNTNTNNSDNNETKINYYSAKGLRVGEVSFSNRTKMYIYFKEGKFFADLNFFIRYNDQNFDDFKSDILWEWTNETNLKDINMNKFHNLFALTDPKFVEIGRKLQENTACVDFDISVRLLAVPGAPRRDQRQKAYGGQSFKEKLQYLLNKYSRC